MRHNFQTLTQLTQRVIQRLSMYTGTSVQVYAEDRIAQMILDNYTLAFDDFDWQCLSFWKKYTLSGMEGKVVETVSNDIVSFDDILCITTDSTYKNPLRNLHHSTNPALITGTVPQYYQESDDANKVFEVLPHESVGEVYVCSKGRMNVNRLVTPEEIIPFDADYLVYATCADYLADDDSSKIQLDKFMKLRDNRMKQLKDIDNAGTFDYNNSIAYSVTSSWR